MVLCVALLAAEPTTQGVSLQSYALMACHDFVGTLWWVIPPRGGAQISLRHWDLCHEFGIGGMPCFFLMRLTSEIEMGFLLSGISGISGRLRPKRQCTLLGGFYERL